MIGFPCHSRFRCRHELGTAPLLWEMSMGTYINAWERAARTLGAQIDGPFFNYPMSP